MQCYDGEELRPMSGITLDITSGQALTARFSLHSGIPMIWHAWYVATA
jgi:hypothetical protein